ncbi:hypothetical protein GSY71_01110 [Pusillimonas sp. TS35]|uniref:hypothetical protein n=1 Tax=Paracandidimonas lactea TaxID=2895524 RepID=UPI0013709156|nr:hypothetical protein [Paracandidimonas lactea]MYN11754.1 hypothetical protein [Pusillimonas sp. TS35]
MTRLAGASGTEPVAPTFSVYHGPDRIGTATDDGPFHGIVPRSLIGGVDHDKWQRYAHQLFDQAIGANADLALLRLSALQHHVLSFQQSAQAARRFVETRLDLHGGHCDLWNIKEGHTSSVWHVAAGDGHSSEEFILNIARDDAAGRELARTAEIMQTIAACHPELAMAKVEDVVGVEIDYFGQPASITVTRNELVRDALEIHLGRDRRTGRPKHVLIERFITDPERPCEIVDIAGRVMTDAECHQLTADLAAFLDTASQIASVDVDINDGDLVWDGNRAVVVAIR